jgi:AraC-like DNA-binding protein
MDQACHLLTRTKMMVKQIAASLGYKDSLYFSRAFKSIHDVAPTLYRVAGSNAMPLLPPINLVSFSPLSGKRQSATKLTQDNTSIGCEDTRKRALPVSE